ncbi:MAG: S9 family peptidase [Pseudomonadota bacterium]
MATFESSSPRSAPYGTWRSPITTEAIVADTVGLDQIAIDGNDIYWIENRASQQGRCVLVRNRDGNNEDITPPPWSVRTRVHEYGGGAYTVADASVYFSNLADQGFYRIDAVSNGDGPRMPVAITRSNDATRRYADAVIDHRRHRLIAVCEKHSETSGEPINMIVAIDISGQRDDEVLADNHDFFASPRLSPDGSQLAWLSWDHPDMPWDGTSLWLAAIDEAGLLGKPRLIAGGRRESIFQPAWSPSGELHFVSDLSGWWNLYRLGSDSAQALYPMAAEFGRAQWTFGVTTYGFTQHGDLLCSYVQDGNWQLARLERTTLALTPLCLPFRHISDLKIGNNFAVFIGGAPDIASSVVRLDLDDMTWQILRRATTLDIDNAYLSIPTAIEFPTTNDLSAHAFFYAPKNRDFKACADERPPLLVLNHGGPTSTANPTLNLSIQFWTSRGFAVVDVNYGGSTGYGRAYRERLYGQWGIVDVEDAISAARFLVARGDVDVERLIIRGSSAGGYTTLAALTFHNYFKAGASYYGVSDLEALARDCHKFESRYLDHLIGPYPAEQATYRARSPIHHVDRLSVPLILFQGLEDKVVPPNQSQMMFDALNEKRLPVAYITFAEEQHGFRRAQNIKHALEAEFYFYANVFGFAASDLSVLIDIKNLPALQ